MQENDLTDGSSSVTKTKMDALHAELSTPHTSPLTAILEDGGPDVAEWNSGIMAPYLGKPWLEAPWLYGEFYLYRRVIEAFQWFRGGADPFAAQKQAGVTSALSSMEALAARL